MRDFYLHVESQLREARINARPREARTAAQKFVVAHFWRFAVAAVRRRCRECKAETSWQSYLACASALCTDVAKFCFNTPS